MEEDISRQAEHLAQSINLKALSLLEVVESLKSSLESTDNQKRGDGVTLLKDVLCKIEENSLKELEVTTMLNFFLSLMDQHPLVFRPALHAFHTLFKRQTVSPAQAGVFVERFLNESALVDLTKEDKTVIYKVFFHILSDQKMLEEIKKMESSFIPGFLQLVEMETDPQCLMLCFSMFQIVSKNFPFGIYADDLFEFPAAYFPIDFNAKPEKHGGVSREMLSDAVEKCLMSHECFAENTVTLCLEKATSDLKEAQIDGLKLLKLVVQENKPQLTAELLGAIWPPLRKLYIGHRGNDDIAELVLRVVTVVSEKLSQTNNCQDELERFFEMLWKDINDKEALVNLYGWRLVIAFSGGSALSSEIGLCKMIPLLTQMLADDKSISPSVLDATSSSVQIIVLKNTLDMSVKLQPVLEMLIVQCCTLLLQPAVSNHLQPIIKAIEGALPLKNVILPAQQETIKRFFEIQMSSETPSAGESVLRQFLSSCCKHFSEDFINDLHRLAVEKKSVWLLSGLANDQNCEYICDKLFEINNASALDAIKELMLTHPKSLVNKVLQKVLDVTDINESDQSSFQSLLTSVFRNIDQSQIDVCLDRLFTAVQHQPSVFEYIKLRVLLSNIPKCEKIDTCPHALIKLLCGNAVSSNNASIWQILAVIINKTRNDQLLEGTVAEIKQTNNMMGLTYATKALLFRGHVTCTAMLEECADHLDEGVEAANLFSAIVLPEVEVFPKQGGHCDVKVLYPQRFLTICVDMLLNKFEDSSEEDRIFIATALCLSLQNCHRDLSAKYVEKIRPVVLWCLDQKSLPPECSRGLLLCVSSSLSTLKNDVDTIIPRLVELSSPPAKMIQRIEAMHCLVECRKKLQTHILLPHKRKVISSLPLSDKKRLVRVAASSASMAWHTLGEIP